jgi:atypical dual specificity phosphatase
VTSANGKNLLDVLWRVEISARAILMLRNFSYIVEGKLAGCGFPGSYGNLRRDLEEIASLGFGALASLTEENLEEALLAEFGIDYLHVPIADFEAPTMEQIVEFVAFVRDALAQGKKVLVHCWAGYGRTGTMLACYLVSTGLSADEAVRRIRRTRFGSIETESQERMIYAYEEFLTRGGSGDNEGAH